METSTTKTKLFEIAGRIREAREIAGLSVEETAMKTEVSVDEYLRYEAGQVDFPFSFIHKCALVFDVGMADILEGQSANLLSAYTITRKDHGQQTAKENGIDIKNLAPKFRKKLAEPYWVRYEYSADQQNRPIHLTKHSGQEFDLIISGSLKVQIGENTEVLHEGDSIFYNSSIPHGMIAVDGQDCQFLAVVVSGENTEENIVRESVVSAGKSEQLICEKFIRTQEADNGKLEKIEFMNEDKFNFAFDIVDEIANKYPDKLAMLHLDVNKTERRFTFKDMKRASAQCANYFKSLGIKKGDRVLVVLKRHY